VTLSTFETKDAKYYLGLGRHDKSSLPLFKDVDFSTLDFIVLESGLEYNKPETISHMITSDIQYQGIYERILKENPDLRIYSVDCVPSDRITMIAMYCELALAALGGIFVVEAAYETVKKNKKLTRRDFLKNTVKVSVGTTLSSAGLIIANSDESGIPGVESLNSVRTNLLPSPISGFRDAVTAKKVLEYLVPLHKKKEKLNIALLYGASHTGIETKLKYPIITDTTLWFYKKMEYGKKEDLNLITEIRTNNYQVKLILHDCKLFK